MLLACRTAGRLGVDGPAPAVFAGRRNRRAFAARRTAAVAGLVLLACRAAGGGGIDDPRPVVRAGRSDRPIGRVVAARASLIRRPSACAAGGSLPFVLHQIMPEGGNRNGFVQHRAAKRTDLLSDARLCAGGGGRGYDGRFMVGTLHRCGGKVVVNLGQTDCRADRLELIGPASRVADLSVVRTGIRTSAWVHVGGIAQDPQIIVRFGIGISGIIVAQKNAGVVFFHGVG